ncbi:MAG: DUF1707 and DUF2154 domain-containing protein [Gemmatimonadaceae bacterium]|nr:DUF1707 and DUF2154 domain-containing protein [Gemmatimonadaceae bacterium]
MTDIPITARRDQIVAHLGAAWAAEAIGEQEMERRMSAAFAAREPADLERLVADLPMPHALAPMPDTAHPVAPRGPQLAPLRRVLFSSVEERVRSVVPARVELGSRFGSIAMNFTEAVFANAVTEIVVDVVFGNVELTFPAGVAIECDVNGIFANVEMNEPTRRAAPSGQVVRISGRALFGNVEIDVAGAMREA